MRHAADFAPAAEALHYEGKYLGSCVANGTGDTSCLDCVERVRQLKQPTKQVLLDITPTSVQARAPPDNAACNMLADTNLIRTIHTLADCAAQVSDSATLELITSVPRENVVYIYADKADKRLLAYISRDFTTDIMVCHVFATRDAARDVLSAIVKLVDIPHHVTGAAATPDAPEASDHLPMQIFKAEYMGSTLVSTPHPHTQARHMPDSAHEIAHISARRTCSGRCRR